MVSVFDALDRLDEAVFSRWPPQEVLGFLAIAVGAPVAAIAFPTCVILQLLKDVI